MQTGNDTWDSSDPYEYFMGRWSKLMAPQFLDWLNCPSGLAWLDIGCGTGALSEAIVNHSMPGSVSCVDSSPEFLKKASQRLPAGARLLIGDASTLPVKTGQVDVAVSGLALNFFPDIPAAILEMKRVLKKSGTIAAYVWDYADKMEMLRYFWDAAIEVDPAAKQLDEGERFKVCDIARLEQLFSAAGLSDIETNTLDVQTVFSDFADYWDPFLGGQGPAGSFLISLKKEKQEMIREQLFKKLPRQQGDSIRLIARALAVRGRK